MLGLLLPSPIRNTMKVQSMIYNIYIKKEERKKKNFLHFSYHENKKYKKIIEYKFSIFTYSTNAFYMVASIWLLVWFHGLGHPFRFRK